METRFEFKDFVKVFGLGIFIYSIFLTIFAYIPAIGASINSLHPTLSFLINYSIQIFILFFPVYIFVVKKYQANSSDFGFQRISLGRLTLYVLGTYIFNFVLTAAISTYLYSYQLDLPGYKPQASHLTLFGTDMFGYISAFFFVVLLAPFLEEVFFRGFVYRILIKTWSPWFGSIITALLFALFHFEFQSFIPLFILGLLLNFTYQRTSSIWTSVCFHSLNNAVALGMEVYVYYHPDFLKELVKPIGLL